MILADWQPLIMVHYLQVRCREGHPQRPTAEQSAHIWTDARALPPCSRGWTPGRISREQLNLGQWWLRTQHRLWNQRARFTRWQIKSFKDLTFLFFPLLWNGDKTLLGFLWRLSEVTDVALRTQLVLAIIGTSCSFHSWGQGWVSSWLPPSDQTFCDLGGCSTEGPRKKTFAQERKWHSADRQANADQPGSSDADCSPFFFAPWDGPPAGAAAVNKLTYRQCPAGRHRAQARSSPLLPTATLWPHGRAVYGEGRQVKTRGMG